MSSKATPIDSWISDFKDLLVPPATSSSSFDVTTVPSLTASGSSGGPDGEFDGGAKRTHLFHFTSVLARSGTICLGVVGTGGRRFCIKKATSCGAKSHATAKFSPSLDTFYLKSNDTCAHTVPSLPARLVPADELAVIQASKHTVDEWTDIFTRYSEPRRLDGDEPVEPAELINKVVLKTPAKSSNYTAEEDIMVYLPRGIHQVIAQADDIEALLAVNQDSLPAEITSFLGNVLKFLLDFDHWWKTPLADTYSSVALIKEDLYTLKQRCEHLHLLAGKPMTISDTDFPDLWSALEFMSTIPRPEKGMQIGSN
jgi:hypothetical protein